MSLADFKVFNDFTQGAASEHLAYLVELFNTASRGGLILTSGSNIGDFADKTNWAIQPNLVRRRNAYATGAVSAVAFSQLQETSVKVDAGTPPVQIDKHWFERIGKDQRTAGQLFGTQLAEQRLADMVNVAINAAKAAHVGIATNFNDGTANNASLPILLQTAGKLGDRSSAIACWIAHSKVLFDIWGANLANTNSLFSVGTVNIMSDAFGRVFVMTDQPALIDPIGINDGDGSSGDGDTGGAVQIPSYFTLGLVPGAVLVEDNGDYTQNVDTRNGDESIRTTLQAQWSYQVAVKGFAWDKDNGGKSPTTSALATSSNWDRQATSFKDLGGVILESK